MTGQYEKLGVNADRAVSQWRLTRHLVNDLPVTLSLTDTYMKVPTDFNDLRMLYRIAMIIPVTTAGVEHGFLKLTYVKNKLRSTMQQDGLQSLILASTEKDLVQMVCVDDLVARFSGVADRRLDTIDCL